MESPAVDVRIRGRGEMTLEAQVWVHPRAGCTGPKFTLSLEETCSGNRAPLTFDLLDMHSCVTNLGPSVLFKTYIKSLVVR